MYKATIWILRSTEDWKNNEPRPSELEDMNLLNLWRRIGMTIKVIQSKKDEICKITIVKK